jgi:hypothetical protein
MMRIVATGQPLVSMFEVIFLSLKLFLCINWGGGGVKIRGIKFKNFFEIKKEKKRINI